MILNGAFSDAVPVRGQSQTARVNGIGQSAAFGIPSSDAPPFPSETVGMGVIKERVAAQLRFPSTPICRTPLQASNSAPLRSGAPAHESRVA